MFDVCLALPVVFRYAESEGCARYGHHKKTTRRFETRGIVVNPGATPLMSAAYRGNYELASLLLNSGAVDPEDIAFNMARMKHDRKMMELIRSATKTKS